MKFVWERLPEADIVSELERLRGHGRDDHPVRAKWRALVARQVLRHDPDASFLRTLRNNPALLELYGLLGLAIDLADGGDLAPAKAALPVVVLSRPSAQFVLLHPVADWQRLEAADKGGLGVLRLSGQFDVRRSGQQFPVQ